MATKLARKEAELTRPPFTESQMELFQKETDFMHHVAKLIAMEEVGAGRVVPYEEAVIQKAKQFYAAWSAVEGPLNMNDDPNVRSALAARATATRRATKVKTLPHLTTFSAERINRRNIPKNAKNAITGTPIRSGERALNFNGEYVMGRYYQNSAPNILATRRNPRSLQNLQTATWYMP